MQADHIIPVGRTVLLKDFVLLNDERALNVLNHPDFLQPLNRATNSAKQERFVSEMTNWQEHMTAAQRAELIAKEEKMLPQLEELIQRQLREQLKLGH